jgi:primosomal replication protein N
VANQLHLSAKLTHKEPIRYTPAGAAVLSFRVEHHSTQTEAGRPRDVTLEAECVALGDTAQQLEAVAAGSELEFTGFIALKSRLSRMLVIHVDKFDLK